VSSAPTEQAILRVVEPSPEERYVNCLPLIPLKAAAGLFSDPQLVPEDSEWDQWVAVEAGRKLRRGMFVAQIIGKSMEPRIPDGSYCLFSSPVEGSRQGKIVLVQLRSQTDPENGARYTIKRYESEKSHGEDGTWRHIKITLKPLNTSFSPIVLAEEDEDSLAVIAEFLQVL
jgi:SOS-response transcriptional repressor LexA